MRSKLSLLGVATSLLMVTACASKPIKPPQVPFPNEPIAAMVDVSPPDPPVSVSGLAPEVQSRRLLEDYTEAMQWGTDEARMRQVLIDYIRKVKEWYEQL